MNNRVLIYMEEHYLKPIGGPAGYLYNLKNELDRRKNKDIEFIKKNDKHATVKKTVRKMPKFLYKLLLIFKRVAEISFLLSSRPKITDVNLDDYDMVHFHSTFRLFEAKDSLKNYKGKVLLTSHSPKPLFMERMEDMATPLERKIFKRKYLRLSSVDEYAFNRADYIIFPCPEAEEPYLNNWEKFSEIKEKNKDKFRYLLTGINECNVKVGKEEIRRTYKIPDDAFIISYAGRHNVTKGYDMLLKIGEKLLHEDHNIYFLIAGKEEPLKGIKNDRWIEVGWTNDPHSLIAASDVFVLPNKETYFDIVMLEVLSLGKIVVASNTGGNKYFKKINAEGIFLYNTIDEAVSLLNRVMDMPHEEKNRLEQFNKRLFNEKFTGEIFCNNYIELLNELKRD